MKMFTLLLQKVNAGTISRLISTVFLFVTASFFQQVNAQAIGDYRSNAASFSWTSTTNWQRWNGSTWVSNPSQGYPGQNTGTGLVTIQNGHSVSLDVTPAANIGSLTVGGGSAATLTIGSSNTDRTLTVTGNVIVNASATLTSTGNGGNLLKIGGNLTNNGTFTSNGSDMDVEFNGSANQTVSGTGATTSFNFITINNSGSANNDIVEISSSNFSAAAGFLTLSNGTLKMSGSYTFSNTFFNSATYAINAGNGLWINNANVTVTAQGGSPVVAGTLRISAGTFNVGTASGNSLTYSTGSNFIIEGGSLNIAGRFSRDATNTSTTTYNQSGGTVTLVTLGSTSTTRAGFDIASSGSSFSMSGGSIVFQRATSNTDDYVVTASTTSVTGGTLQIGNASTPASQVFAINTTAPVYNITFNATNSPSTSLNAALSVLNDLTLSGGTFSASNLNISIAGDWINNGGTFTAGTGTVTFNSTAAAQAINGSAASQSFNNITVNKSGQTLSVGGSTATLNMSGTLTLTAGTFNAGTATAINMTGSGGNWTNNGGTFTPGSSNITFSSTSGAQAINGTAVSQTFSSISVNKSGQTLSVGGSTTSLTLNNALTITAGTFNIGTATTLNIAGNFANSGTFTAGSGTVVFNGASGQTISGSSATTFNNLTLNDAGGLSLSQAATVNATLLLSAGSVSLGSNNLTIGASGVISGAASTRYIVTGSTGQLRRTVAASAVSFPVGNASYNPITVTNSGTSDVYGMRVLDGSFTTNDNTKIINRRWVVTENTSGGSNLAVVAQYNSGEEAAGFNAGSSAYMGFFNGTSWIHRSATQAGAGPFTFTSTSNFAPTNLTTGTQYFALGKDEAFVLIASKFAITSITPSSPTAGSAFNVTVQSQNASNVAANVVANTSFTLSTNGNAGTIGGTITGTINAGSNSVTVTGVTLSTPGTGATLTATQTSGDALTSGTSAAFNVLNPASQLVFVGVPGTGTRGSNISSFTVEARRPDNSLDNTYTGSITISKASGPATGSVSGTLTVTAVAGVATFNAVQFDIQGTYTLNANAASLTQATTGNIVIGFVSLATDHFRSAVSSGNYTTAASWTSSGDNITFLPATLAPTSSASSILIQSGHTIFATSTPSVNNLTVQGTYEHRFNGGTLPTATWAAGSTCLVTNVTNTAPGNNNQNFYHFTWASNSTGQIDILTTSSIGGNLTISGGTSAAGNEVRNSTTPFTIGGDLIISGNGNIRIGSGTARSVIVNGNVSITGGTLNMSNGNAIGSLTVNGNFTHSGGTINETSTGSGSITFDGSVKHVYTSGGTLSGVINYTVAAGDTLQMGTGASPAVISSGSTGTFTLSAGATLGITSSAGITATGATGNIQSTGVRTFSTSANYIYNGSAVQSTGNGLPATINDLTIDNSGGSTGVTLTANLAMTGDLNFVNGLITTNANTIVLSSSSVINNASASSYINGKLARVFAATGAKTFPVGKGGNYRPVTFNYTVLTGTSTVTVEQFESGLTTTVAPPARRLGTRYWNISQSGALAAQYKVTLDKTGLTQDGASTVVMIKSDGGAGVSAAATNADPLYTNVADYNSLTATASSFMLGENNIPTTTVVSPLTSVTYGSTTPVTLTATVSSNSGAVTAGGTVTFLVDGNAVGTGTTNASGVATYSYNPSALTVVGSPHTVTANYAAIDIYAASTGSTSWNITQKTLTITANDQVKCAGQTFSFAGTEFSVNGLINGDNVTGVTLSSAGATAGAAAGNYAIVPSAASGSGLGNYSITYINGNMLVNSRPTAVISGDATICYGTGTTTVTLNVTGAGTISGQLSNGTNFSGTAPVINVNVGPFTTTTVITVSSLSDANCTAIGADLTGSATITIPSQLAASAVADSVIKCNGGTTTVTVSATGGTAPYTGTGTFTVSAGTHNYSITDALGCTTSTSVTVTEPTLLNASAVADSIIKCNGGTTTVTVSATGGTAPYSGTGTFTVSAGTHNYIITDALGCITSASVTVAEPTLLNASAVADSIIKCNGGTTTVTVSATGGTAPYSGTGTFTVSAGTYNYTVTDANGCATSVSVTVTEPVVLNATAVADSAIKCNGGTTTVTVSATGGTAPYTGTGSFTVSGGTHNYTVTDANGCVFIATVTVNQPTVLNATAVADSIIKCYGGVTTVTVSGSGGTAPYSGGGTYTVSAGTYNYVITDANGCSALATVTVGEPAVLSASAVADSIIKCNGGTTTVTVSATGGTAPYTGTGVFTVTAGTFSYTIVDANGCTTLTSVTVSEPSLLGATSVLDSAIKCRGGVTTVTVAATGGTAPYTGTGSFTVAAGTHNFLVKDANGCTTVTTIIVGQPAALVASSTAPAIVCRNGTTTVTVSATGGTAPYTGTGDFVVGPGTYTYTVTDANGCSSNTSITLINPPVQPLPVPGTISGPVDVCPYVGQPTTATYSIAAVPNALSYYWAVSNGGTIVSGQGTTTVQISYATGFYAGNVSVKANYLCGSSVPRLLALDINVPQMPAQIFGQTDVCAYVGTTNNVTYYIKPVQYANAYEWTVPTGAVIVSGQGDTLITVNYPNGFSAGERVSVRSLSNCFVSAFKSTLPITPVLPARPGAISGPINACPYVGTNTEVTYRISRVANATSYFWTVPAGVDIVSDQGDTAIRVKFNNAFTSGNIGVSAVANCGSSTERTLGVSRVLPGTPGSITGTTDACPLMGTANTTTYTIRSVLNATSYNWSVPAGASIVSGQGDTTVVVSFSNAFVSGNISVSASNTCATSAARTLAITRRLPATPGNISGPTDPCPYIGTTTNVQYSIRSVVNATYYNWTVPVGVIIVSGQGDTSILVNFTNAYNTGNISVAAVANCGSSANRTLNLVKKLPNTPGAINAGTPTACPNRQVVYSIAAVPNATYYYWTVPAGAVIISGDSTTSIVVEYPSGAVSDTVRVRSGSNCSMSPERKLKVTLSACPPMPIAKTNGKGTTTAGEVADLTVTVLPNPSTDRFRIVIGYGNGQPVNIMVSDVNGRVQETRMKLMPGQRLALGDTYKPGIYFMQLIQGDIHKVVKLIKQ